MGLDNFVAIKSAHSVLETTLPNEIRDLFQNVKVAEIGENTVSLRGKAYNQIIGLVTNRRCFLYEDLDSHKLFFICVSLDEYLRKYERVLKRMNEFAKEEWENKELLEQWFEDIFNMCHPTFDELCSLREFFRICADNNLSLYASN